MLNDYLARLKNALHNDIEERDEILNFMEEMINDGVIAIWIENDNGVLTAYALGAQPSSALTVQYIRSEVMA